MITPIRLDADGNDHAGSPIWGHSINASMCDFWTSDRNDTETAISYVGYTSDLWLDTDVFDTCDKQARIYCISK